MLLVGKHEHVQGSGKTAAEHPPSALPLHLSSDGDNALVLSRALHYEDTSLEHWQRLQLQWLLVISALLDVSPVQTYGSEDHEGSNQEQNREEKDGGMESDRDRVQTAASTIVGKLSGHCEEMTHGAQVDCELSLLSVEHEVDEWGEACDWPRGVCEGDEESGHGDQGEKAHGQLFVESSL